MSDYYVMNPIIGAPTPVSATASSPQFPLGLEVFAVDRGNAYSTATAAATATNVTQRAGVFVYCQGSNVSSAGNLVSIFNGSAVLATIGNSASNAPLGIAAGTLSATNQYGWVMVQGRCDWVKCTNHSFAAGVHLYLGSTAGYPASVFSSGGRIYGMVAPVSNHSSLSAGSMTFDLNRPFLYNGPCST